MAKALPENPLIPHARMRALYRGLVEARALIDTCSTTNRLPRWSEACWVATAMTLEEGDLTIDADTAAMTAYLRSLSLRPPESAPSEQDLKSFFANVPSPSSGTSFERLLCSVGASMALKAASTRRLTMAYLRDEDISAAEWKRFARVTGPNNLPLIVVVAGNIATPTPGPAIPVIPVEGSDTLAIYRVAQEAVVRSRSGGGVVILDCTLPLTDPVSQLASQMLTKGVCNPEWPALVARQTTRAISKLVNGVHLSKGKARPDLLSDRTT